MALQVEVQVVALTQLQHCGKGAAVQLKYVQQAHNSRVPVYHKVDMHEAAFGVEHVLLLSCPSYNLLLSGT